MFFLILVKKIMRNRGVQIMLRQKSVEFFIILIFSLLPVVQSNAQDFLIPEEAKNKIIGVNIDDLVNVYPKLIPGLANVSVQIKKSPQSFFVNGTVQTLHVIFMREMPVNKSNQIELKLSAYVKYKESSMFENITILYSNNAKSLQDIQIIQDSSMNLKDMRFTLNVGLVDRKLIIKDELNSIKFLFPIGVGGFDEGVLNEGKVSLLTPRFKVGYIDQRAVISSRTKPRYFDGKPFIRLLKGEDLKLDTTAIGFHTEINDSFVRGFDSHGCMRLRVPDLMALHDLIMDGDELKTPITVNYRTLDKADHPAPKRNGSYKAVLNNGTELSPFFPLDRDNLVQMTLKDKAAPVEKLQDSEADHYEDIFSYDTQLQLREQNERRKNECQIKLMEGKIGTSDKDLENCLEEGKRKDTMKDRLYRKFMGIDGVSESELSLI